ncbi:amidase family protein, partial [Ruminococcus sp.]|uniref:amidase family protein n=1 Tax=Ruminococcus sp. TaxID=41978 RepID=UPI003FEE4252
MKIRDMRKALDSKEISAKELAQTYFERIKKYDDKVKSFITVTEEKALEQAEKAQAVIDKGEAKALTGIPVAVKDNICTAGVQPACASKMLENYVPPYSATVMEKLGAENIVVL